MKRDINTLVLLLRTGGVAVIRTDTLYGIVARADDEQAVERVYRIKQRNPQKSFIILVADDQQTYTTVTPDLSASQPTSFLINSPQAPRWLRRADDSLAYRQPNTPWLRRLLYQTGPLIAPSANPEGQPPARTITEARSYFGDQVDFYLDGGTVPEFTPPSRLIRICPHGQIEQLR